MAITKVCLVTAALLAAVVAFPECLPGGDLDCNTDVTHTIIFDGQPYDLRTCTKNNQLCVTGIPDDICGQWTIKCVTAEWKNAAGVKWTISICSQDFTSAKCYKPGTVTGIQDELHNCNNVVLQAFFVQLMDPKPICFCFTDETGYRECFPPGCD